MGSGRSNDGVKLTPAQIEAREALRQGLKIGAVLALGSEIGRGKSTVLADLRRELGGSVIRISDLLEETGKRHPLALEESAFEIVLGMLKRDHLVIVDDFEILVGTVCCHGSYPRVRWLDGASLALCRYAAEGNRKLIFSYSGMLPGPIHECAIKAGTKRFRAKDYKVLAANYLGEAGEALDFEKVFRFAPRRERVGNTSRHIRFSSCFLRCRWAVSHSVRIGPIRAYPSEQRQS